MKNSWFQRYLLPGFIFQSLIIAGAYGSGAELKQFFLPLGPLGGLYGMVVTMVVFSAVAAVTFEVARRFGHYDYRTFFQELLGPAWWLYEILYVLTMILVISVIGATAGTLIASQFNLPPLLGSVTMIALIGLLVFYGTAVIERFLALWSFLLYAAYILFFIWNFAQFGDVIRANMSEMPIGDGVIVNGVKYAGYNLAMLPAILFCVRHMQSRRDAIGAGLFAGPIAMIPAVLFFSVMAAHHGAIVDLADTEVPVAYMLAQLENGAFFAILFPIILFGTFVETGAGLIHAVNERIAHVYKERSADMPRILRPAIAVAVLLVSIFLADAVGLVGLVREGYGTITYAFLAVYVLPVLTWGIWKLKQAGPE